MVPNEPLTAPQRAFLEALRDRTAFQGFYLAGGTALALRLGHRRSLGHIVALDASWEQIQAFFRAEVTRARL